MRGHKLHLILVLLTAAAMTTHISLAQPSESPSSSPNSATTSTTTTSTTTSHPESTTQAPSSKLPTPSETTLPVNLTIVGSDSAAPVATATKTTPPPPPASTENIEEVKKIVRQYIEHNHRENRLVLNKPTLAPAMVDFAPESIEARVADATTDFGLRFINNLPADNKDNIVLSPMSLQNLLNMILLGASDNSATQQELAQVLGYTSTELLAKNSSSPADRLRPHEAMRNVFQNILAATHLSVSQPAPIDQSELLNTNSASLQPDKGSVNKVTAHLQTTSKEGDTPLDGQLNFTLANLVLTNKELVELKPDYENDLKTYYKVNIEQFSRDSSKQGGAKIEPALHERVNKWVKNMTHNQIEKLAEASDLDGNDLIMVLLNAAHFKGRWLHTFNAKATYERTFFNHGLEKKAVPATFMRQKSMLGYADFSTNPLLGDLAFDGGKTRSLEEAETVLTEDAQSVASNKANQSASGSEPTPTIELSKEEMRRIELTSKLNCTVLMLPFSLNDGQELSMVILLPAKRDGVAELQAALTSSALNEIYKSLSELQVQVELPKFAFEASHDAKETLLKMGLKSIFNESANLDRMYAAKLGGKQLPVKVDKVIHKAKISVDESGAEAAAASMASVVLRNFIRPPTPIFIADHPFLFVIRHNRSNMPLFMGRVSNL